MFGWPSPVIFLAGIPVNALWALAGSTSQALMTRRVSSSEQGELQGALASLRGVAMLIGPGLFSLTFAYFISPAHFVPGAPWHLATILMQVSLAVAWSVTGGKDKDREIDKDKGKDKNLVDGGLTEVGPG